MWPWPRSCKGTKPIGYHRAPSAFGLLTPSACLSHASGLADGYHYFARFITQNMYVDDVKVTTPRKRVGRPCIHPRVGAPPYSAQEFIAKARGLPSSGLAKRNERTAHRRLCNRACPTRRRGRGFERGAPTGRSCMARVRAPEQRRPKALPRESSGHRIQEEGRRCNQSSLGV